MDSNISSTNSTESPCELAQLFQLKNVTRHEQCEFFQAIIKGCSHPIHTFISTIGIILNIIVVVVIRRSMTRRQTQAQIHLLTLAVSDITLGIAAVCEGALGWTCDLCLPCGQGGACHIVHAIVFYIWTASYSVNRVLTMSISIIRLKAIRNAINARISRRKSQRRTMIDLGVLVIILYLILNAYVWLALRALHSNLSFPVWQVWCIVAATTSVFQTITISCVTGFILAKLRRRECSFLSSQEVDFQRLVALVAVIFCCAELVISCLHGFHAINDNFETFKDITVPTVYTLGILNSSVNLFVYLVASRNFRATFIDFCKGFGDDTKTDTAVESHSQVAETRV